MADEITEWIVFVICWGVFLLIGIGMFLYSRRNYIGRKITITEAFGAVKEGIQRRKDEKKGVEPKNECEPRDQQWDQQSFSDLSNHSYFANNSVEAQNSLFRQYPSAGN